MDGERVDAERVDGERVDAERLDSRFCTVGMRLCQARDFAAVQLGKTTRPNLEFMRSCGMN